MRAGLGLLLPVVFPLLVEQSTATVCLFKKVIVSQDESSPTTMKASWSWQTCASDLHHYRVKVTHLSWLACQNGEYDRDEITGVKDYEVSYPSLDMSGLYPYSNYLLKLQAVDSGGSIIAEKEAEFSTPSDVPDTKPRPSSIQGGSETYPHSIRFYWLEPADKECRHQNGRQNGYWVELRGLDPWVIEPHIIINQTIKGGDFFVDDLKPYTSYMLRVFSMNVESLINQNVYLELQERTKPWAPSPPQNVSCSSISESSIYLSWRPDYPRTGLIMQYIVRRGQQSRWSTQLSVDTTLYKACTDDTLRRDGHVCYVINDLEAATEYEFQVQTVNKDIQDPSKWSKSAVCRTDKEPTGVVHPTSSPKPSIPPPSADTDKKEAPVDNQGGNTVVVVILCLAGIVVILVIILAFIIFKFKLKKLKERLQLEQSINMSRMDSIYTEGSILSHQQDNISTNTSIQARRLPEPPPDNHVYQQPYTGAAQQRGYLDMSAGSRRNSKLSSSSHGGEISGVDPLDLDGYLKPTFQPPDVSRSYPVWERDDGGVGTVREAIPAESYGSVPQPTAVSANYPHHQAGWATDSGSGGGKASSQTHQPDLIPQVAPDGSAGSSSASLNFDDPQDQHAQLIISKSIDI